MYGTSRFQPTRSCQKTGVNSMGGKKGKVCEQVSVARVGYYLPAKKTVEARHCGVCYCFRERKGGKSWKVRSAMDLKRSIEVASHGQLNGPPLIGCGSTFWETLEKKNYVLSMKRRRTQIAKVRKVRVEIGKRRRCQFLHGEK